MPTNSDIQKSKMLQALERSMGIVTQACRKVGIARSTHYDWIEKDEQYRKNVESLADVALDFAETKLMASIKRGSDTATIFYLKTKGKKRGYIEKMETETVFTGTIGVNLTHEQIKKISDKLDEDY